MLTLTLIIMIRMSIIPVILILTIIENKQINMIKAIRIPLRIPIPILVVQMLT